MTPTVVSGGRFTTVVEPSTSGPGTRCGPRPCPRLVTRSVRRPAGPADPQPVGLSASSTRRVTCSTRSRISSTSSLAAEPCRLGAVLVGIAEHTHDIELCGHEEVAQRPELLTGFAWEAHDVATHTGVRVDRTDLAEQVEEPVRVRTFASASARQGRRAGRTGRSTGPPLAWPRWPGSGPVAARRVAGTRHAPVVRPPPRRDRAGASPATGGRRDPCRRKWSSPRRGTSRTPCPASHRASSSSSVGRRDTNEPRKVGMAQNVQRRSQPDASFSGAIGPSPSRLRTARGPLAGEMPAGRSGNCCA